MMQVASLAVDGVSTGLLVAADKSSHYLKPPMRGKRVGLMARDNDMVQYPDVNERASRSQGLGQCLVGGTGFGRTGRMVMRQDDAGRINRKRPADDLAWVYRRLGQRSPEQFFSHDEAVSGVQKQGCKHFERSVAQPKLQETRDLRWICEGVASRELVCKCASGQFKCRP